MTGSGSSADEIWLTATWPFVRDQLPRPPARVVELGCGEAGGQVTALLSAGYDATGVDPEAPEGPVYQRIPFEDYWPDTPLDAVIASLSLHHAADPATISPLCSLNARPARRFRLSPTRAGSRRVLPASGARAPL